MSSPKYVRPAHRYESLSIRRSHVPSSACPDDAEGEGVEVVVAAVHVDWRDAIDPRPSVDERPILAPKLGLELRVRELVLASRRQVVDRIRHIPRRKDRHAKAVPTGEVAPKRLNLLHWHVADRQEADARAIAIARVRVVLRRRQRRGGMGAVFPVL
jgi:hypothetical protein